MLHAPREGAQHELRGARRPLAEAGTKTESPLRARPARWGYDCSETRQREALGPLLIGAAVGLAPAATGALQQRLEAADLDADGLNARIEGLLDKP